MGKGTTDPVTRSSVSSKIHVVILAVRVPRRKYRDDVLRKIGHNLTRRFPFKPTTKRFFQSFARLKENRELSGDQWR
jgi:hypothetical protein